MTTPKRWFLSFFTVLYVEKYKFKVSRMWQKRENGIRDIFMLHVPRHASDMRTTLPFFHKNIVFPAQTEYSYFSANVRLKIFL